MNGKNIPYFVAICLAIVGFAVQASAQSDDDIWGSPQNLSKSGAATEPRVVTDANGSFHVIWLDSFDGFVYTRGDGEVWTAPSVVELPFGTRRYSPDLGDDEPTPYYIPQLIFSGWGVHAFWRDEENTLFTSSVNPGELGDFNAWLARRQLSEAVVAYDLAVDPDGQLHVVIVRTAHSSQYPAGIYYIRSVDGGSTWSTPVALYQTIYYRLLEESDVGVSITAGYDGRLYVVWSDSREGKIYYIQSPDEGEKWEAIEMVSGYSDESSLDFGFQKIMEESIITTLTETLLFWQIGNDTECDLYYQLSTDFGENWTDGEILLDSGGCSDIKNILVDEKGGLIIHVDGEDGEQLISWQDESLTESLELPVAFVDKKMGNWVQMESVQVVESSRGQVLVVGCDQNKGSEIWAIVRSKASLVEELLNSPVSTLSSPWSIPEEISPVFTNGHSPAVTADFKGRFHFVWSQPAEFDLKGLGRTLYYVCWDEKGWSFPVPIFSLAGEKAEHPSIALDTGGLLHLVWSGGEAGDILYSRVESDHAGVTDMWADSTALPMPGSLGSSPVIKAGEDNLLNVVFAVPINEGRGIYYTKSIDGGKNWSSPIVVFDAAESGWPSVDQPDIAVGSDGTLHVVWARLPMANSFLPGGIYYARSIDGGESWSEAFEITSNKAQWPQIITVEKLEVHVIWDVLRERYSSDQHLHRWSSDAGRNWSIASTIPSFEGIEGLVGFTTDGAGRVHIVAVGRNASEDNSFYRTQDKLPLIHKVWIDNFWNEENSGNIKVLNGDNVNMPLYSSAYINYAGRLGLIFLAPIDGENNHAIYFTSRALELTNEKATPLPSLTPTPIATQIPTATTFPTPTALPSFETLSESQIQLSGTPLGNYLPAIGAIILSTGFILSLVMIAIFKRRKYNS